MVERGGKSVTFQPPITLLSSLPQFPRADITNPRDLYSWLSESRSHGNIKPKAGGRSLPPLYSAETAEIQLRGLEKGLAHHGSFPDLQRLLRDDNGESQKLPSLRRSSSLQDVSKAAELESNVTIKKLKPILKHKAGDDLNKKSEGEQLQQPQGAVKFGYKEVRLIKDNPLPPIEGKGYLAAGQADKHHTNGVLEAPYGLSPVYEHHGQVHRRPGPDCSPDIFPRGVPVEVKKPLTPTYDDFPEAYWELRSPTVQDPSDLKEDMIDRDRYRLQQISTLKLKAVPRELAASKLDTYRKWQQQMQESTPTPRGVTATPSAAATPGGNHAHGSNSVNGKGEKNVKPQKLPVPVQTLSVAATSISPSVHPGPKRRNTLNGVNGTQNEAQLTEDEIRHREKLKTAAMTAGEQGSKNGAPKPVKAAVVNLAMERSDLHSGTPTSELYTGIRRVVMTTRPQSDRSYLANPGHNSVASVRKHPGSALSSITGSNCATIGSMNRVPSAPSASPPNTSQSAMTAAATPSSTTDKTGKKILKRFNRLQVFSEKMAVQNGDVSNVVEEDELVTPPDKTPYMPQNRPPTYRLDMRNYPPRRSGSANQEWIVTAENDDLAEYPLLPGDPRGVINSPSKSEATSLNFRFRNGEVIVSRQGKRQLAA